MKTLSVVMAFIFILEIPSFLSSSSWHPGLEIPEYFTREEFEENLVDFHKKIEEFRNILGIKSPIIVVDGYKAYSTSQYGGMIFIGRLHCMDKDGSLMGTLMHEEGHISLGHFNDGVPEISELHRQQEYDADCFGLEKIYQVGGLGFVLDYADHHKEFIDPSDSEEKEKNSTHPLSSKRYQAILDYTKSHGWM